MKRMYVTLLIIAVVFIWGLTSLAQIVLPSNDLRTEQQIQHEKRLQMHHDLHQRLRSSLFNGTDDIDQIFKDFEEAFQNDLSSSFPRVGTQQFSSEWSESKDGRILKITPKNKDQNLSIDVQNEMITIKGKNQNSSFQNSFNVPQDCDSTKVKMTSEGNQIVLFLPYKMKLKEERVPLPSTDQDIQI